MSAPRLSVNIGTNFPKEQAPRRNTLDLAGGYNEKVMTSGYRALLRGDKMEGRRFAHFMERTKQAKEGPDPAMKETWLQKAFEREVAEFGDFGVEPGQQGRGHNKLKEVRNKQRKAVLGRDHCQSPEVRSVARLRKMEGRFVWALTVRENISHFFLRLCRLESQSAVRVRNKGRV